MFESLSFGLSDMICLCKALMGHPTRFSEKMKKFMEFSNCNNFNLPVFDNLIYAKIINPNYINFDDLGELSKTLLGLKIDEEEIEIVKCLLQNPFVNPYIGCVYWYPMSGCGDLHIFYLTCLAMAIEKRNLEIVKLLIETKKYTFFQMDQEEEEEASMCSFISPYFPFGDFGVAEYLDSEGDAYLTDYFEFCERHKAFEILEYLKKIEHAKAATDDL